MVPVALAVGGRACQAGRQHRTASAAYPVGGRLSAKFIRLQSETKHCGVTADLSLTFTCQRWGDTNEWW